MEVETQTIYFLLKMHKNPLKIRPIVSCNGGPTELASAFLDRLLQPHMRSVASYLRNSIQLIHMLEAHNFPPGVYLITLDIQSLYTNIDHGEAITAFLRVFSHHPMKVFLLGLLKYVLKNNVFQFDGRYYSQLCGVAMGTKLAPALATIYVGFWRNKSLHKCLESHCCGCAILMMFSVCGPFQGTSFKRFYRP